MSANAKVCSSCEQKPGSTVQAIRYRIITHAFAHYFKSITLVKVIAYISTYSSAFIWIILIDLRLNDALVRRLVYRTK